jgi:hypothetical protein
MNREASQIVAAVLRRERGNAKVAAIECGISPSRLSHMMGDEGSVPVDAIVPISRACRTTDIVEYLAGELGMRLVAAEDVPDEVTLHRRVSRLQRDSAELSMKLEDYASDGLDADEHAELVDLTRTIEANLARVRARLSAMKPAAKPVKLRGAL